MNYIKYNNYWLDKAESEAIKGTCLKRNYGCVIVKDNELLSVGHTRSLGACRECVRKNCPAGQGYEKCPSVHAEQMALIRADGNNVYGATLYLVGLESPVLNYTEFPEPCHHCKKMIIEAGITNVVIRLDEDEFIEIDTIKYLKEMF